MPINHVCKINSLPKMMMHFFWNSDMVSKSTLDARVDGDIISVAIEEKFITLQASSNGTPIYCITAKGREFLK